MYSKYAVGVLENLTKLLGKPKFFSLKPNQLSSDIVSTFSNTAQALLPKLRV